MPFCLCCVPACHGMLLTAWASVPQARPTAASSFQEWEQARVFAEIWRNGLLESSQAMGIDWSFLTVDGAMTKAPLGGGKTGPNPIDRGKRG